MSKYVCKNCGNENVSYQVWVDEDGNRKQTFQEKCLAPEIEWQVGQAMNGQAWCEGEDGCGEIFEVVSTIDFVLLYLGEDE